MGLALFFKKLKMDLELGLKLRRVADEFSSTDFRFSKDRNGPVFISTETDSMFFLKADLKGIFISSSFASVFFFSSGC